MKKDLQLKEVTEFDENLLDQIEMLEEIYYDLHSMLSNYDERLKAVLDRHEQDFLSAYKTHMMKVEKELVTLKKKADE